MIGVILFLLALYLFFNAAKRYLCVCILFTIATAGFQLLPVYLFVMPPVGITKPYDWLLLFCAALLLLSPGVFIQNRAWSSYRNILLFAVALLFLLAYSIFYRRVEPLISMRVWRNYIFFLVLFPFVQLSLQDLLKIFRWVIYATTVASLVYCVQPFVGQGLLNMVGSDLVYTNDEGYPTRYYNLPVFIFPVFFFFFFSKATFGLWGKHLLLGINMLAILLSQHRNLLLSILCCYALHLFLSKKVKPARLLLYAGIVVLAFNIVKTLPQSRFSEGFKDLSGAAMSVSPITLNALEANELSTTEFRWYLFVERLQYVLANPVTTWLGIGLLTEDSRQTRLLRFNIGLPDDNNGVKQVDTGDIIWSVMILQFGIAGIVFFILYYLAFLIKFLAFKTEPVVQIGILFIVVLFITSFYGTAILQPYTTCMLMLFAAYTYGLRQVAPAAPSFTYPLTAPSYI